jgi:hypothetical protein
MSYITDGYRRTGRRQARKITPNNLKLDAINSRNGRIPTIKCQPTARIVIVLSSAMWLVPFADVTSHKRPQCSLVF